MCLLCVETLYFLVFRRFKQIKFLDAAQYGTTGKLDQSRKNHLNKNTFKHVPTTRLLKN